MDYLKRSEELFEETVENRRHLHQTPELGLELPETTAFIMEKLTEMGYDPKRCGGGIVACVGTNVVMCDVKKYEEFRRFAIFRYGEVVRLSQTLPKWIEGKGII